MTEPDGGWPLVGRDNELLAIARALENPGGVLLAGAAGVGKTRLARAALATQTADQVRWVIATESARHIPLGAFAPLLGELPDGAGAALPSAHAALRGGHTLLAVDDAHLLDDASATLLHQLATDHDHRMVVTVRTEQQVPDAVTALWKDGLLTRLEVQALTVEQATTLLERVLDGRLESASAQRLFTATAGNVLWLRHLVDGERAGGRLVCTAGMWHWIDQPQLGSALTALIAARIGQLPGEIRHVLELLALDEPLGIEALLALAGATAVENAADRDLVTVSRSGARWEARLAHPLYGEVVRGQLNPVRARRLRGRLVNVLIAGGGIRDLLRHAVLAVDSDLPPDPDLLLAAAYRAAVLADVVLAERLARAARDCGGGFEVQLLLAFLVMFQMRGEEAEQELANAAACADSDPRALRVAITRAVNLHLMLLRTDEAYAVLGAVEHLAGAEVELLGVRALFAMAANRLEEAQHAGRRALDAPQLSVQAESSAAWALAAVAGLAGLGDQVPALAARGVAAARRAPETTANQTNLVYWEVVGLGLAGWLTQVRETTDWVVATLSGKSMTILRPIFDGWLALLTGRVGTAATLLREFRPYYPGHGGGYTAWYELILAQAQAMTGDAADAREAIARAETSRHPGVTVFEPQFALSRAWLAAAEGSTSTAVTQARRAAMQAAQSGQFAVEVLARHAAVSFGDRAQASRLTELARYVRGPRAPAAAAHAAAWASQDPATLLAASAQLAAADLMLPAAEAAAQATMLYRHRGDHPAAEAAAVRADELTGICEGARTPALLAAAQPLPISERQREVAALAAAQLSNREIAARLGVSVRTVEGHIYHTCLKLGLPNRAALSALFTNPPSCEP